MELYYKYILDAMREQGERYRQRTNALSQQLVVYRQYIWLRQRGESRPIYQFERASGTEGPLSGDNFFADLCVGEDPRWRDLDIDYDYVSDSWTVGSAGDPDFLVYMNMYSRGCRIDTAIPPDDRKHIADIFRHYALYQVADAIDGGSTGGRSWCVLY
jgi:hypothetical protein